MRDKHEACALALRERTDVSDVRLERALTAEAEVKGQAVVIAHLQTELSEARRRCLELEDRLQAKSLAELRAFHPVAMPAQPPEEAAEYAFDDTGLVRERLDRVE